MKKTLLRKRISLASLGFSALLYSILGIVLLFRYERAPSFLTVLLLSYGGLLTLSQLGAFFSNFKPMALVKALFPLIIAVILVTFSSATVRLYAFFLGGYILLLAIINAIDFWVLRGNHLPQQWGKLMMALVFAMLAIPLFVSASEHIHRALVLTGVFALFYSLSLWGDFIRELLPKAYKNKVKHLLRIHLPAILTAFLPRKMQIVLVDLLQEDSVLEEESFKESSLPDLEVFVHVNENGFGAMGHGDIFFEGQVYCYGNYDPGSRRLFDSIGDGVFFTTPDRDAYLQFCQDDTKDTIFAFGIQLDEPQKQAVRKSIQSLQNHMYPWEPPAFVADEKNPDKVPDDFAYQIRHHLGGQVYKFLGTSYKTYFVFTTNCVKFADRVVRATGLTATNPNGIISPGGFYEFFDKQYRMTNTPVISKRTYSNHGDITHKSE